MRPTFRFLNALVWLTQLGLSVIGPVALWVLLALWLRRRFGLGLWVVLVGLLLGLIGAGFALMQSLRLMNRGAKEEQKPPVSFIDHD